MEDNINMKHGHSFNQENLKGCDDLADMHTER